MRTIHDHSQLIEQQEKGEAISLIRLYHFQLAGRLPQGTFGFRAQVVNH